MNDLIEALKIFLKYDNDSYAPTHCQHDILIIANVKPEEVLQEDVEQLNQLGFFISEEYGLFASFRFGSA